MSKLNWVMKVCSIFLLWATAAVALPAQTYTSLFSFDNADGYSPSGGLVRGADGNFYGVTEFGPLDDNKNCEDTCGSVFKITPSGTLTTLHSFQGTDGQWPLGGLIQGTDGNFYGTTLEGGLAGLGTIFKMTPNGTLTTLHNFVGPDGELPWVGLVQGIDGSFYGTTTGGGNSSCDTGTEYGCGTVFKITPDGTFTTLHNFCVAGGYCTDGWEPNASLVQGTDGNLYGTTNGGGASVNCLLSLDGGSCGTIFKITATGTFTTIYDFCPQGGKSCPDGADPAAGLVLGTDGNFYGTTMGGGSGNTNSCEIFGCGTVFKITPSGMLTTLYSFCSQANCTDGEDPEAALVQGTDENFYGVTDIGGAGYGTIFQITPNGTLTTVHTFDDTHGGYSPFTNPLTQDTSGKFYGATSLGGASNACSGGCGTVFSISVGLGPFVEADPRAGRMGAKVGILGTDLTGATSVTFNGTTAAFKVRSKTLIVAEVPSGATTGTIQVAGARGSLSSNVPFIVLP